MGSGNIELTYLDACWCAGTGCGGHRMLPWGPDVKVLPIGCQGVARHTYTPACDGFHDPGPCPPSKQPVTVRSSP